MRRALLVCGILSSLLYLGMNLLIPLRWDGYSFASHTISELSAIDAPTRDLWVWPGRLYTLLVAGFGLGIRLSARGRGRLRLAGTLLLGYGLFGLFWPPMHLRGTEFTLTDTLHIVWTAVSIMLMLTAMGLAAAALGRGFRRYTILTMIVLLATGAMTGTDAPRIAADLPTPRVGVWERITAGAMIAWIAVLATLLLRERPGPAPPAGRKREDLVHGSVAPGFEEVREAFERNFTARHEIGAAVAAWWRGEPVVDLWGGRRIPGSDAPWERDTMVVVMSVTKGMSAMTMAVAHSRGWLDYDVPVVQYWPEFGQEGKAAITVRQLLDHEAGLVLLDEPLTLLKVRDLDGMADLLARQRPAWAPGTRHGYHTMTLGLYMQELIRRVDPAHRTLGRVFQDEIAAPLGLDFHIGLPEDIPDERLARVRTLSPWRGMLALFYTPPAVTLRMIVPGTLLRRSFMGLGGDPNDRDYLAVEVPAGNGVGTARALAQAYSILAGGGAEVGLTPETFALLVEPPRVRRMPDAVLGVPSWFSLGFLRPGPKVQFGSSPRAFGAPGAGGSFAFGDPDARLGYAYVMNRLDFRLENDPRERALRDAISRAIA